jgi:hypothetical protein
MVEFFGNYPFLLYLILGLGCLLLPFLLIITFIFLILSYRQGREFSTPIFKFGQKPKEKSDQIPIANIQNIFSPSPLINHDQTEEFLQRINAKIESIRTENHHLSTNSIYNPPGLPSLITYIYQVRWDIETKIKKWVLTKGGGWAGCSIASLYGYLDNAKILGFPESLIKEILDYYSYSEYIIYSIQLSEDEKTSDETYENIKYYSINIGSKLITFIE